MNFISNLVDEYADGEQNSNSQQNQPYNNQSYNSGYGNNQEPPRVSYPWESEWDSDQDRWVFINRETGQRTHENPGQSYGGGRLGAFEQGGEPGLAGYESQKLGTAALLLPRGSC